MTNQFKRLKALLAQPPLQVGEILSIADGVAMVETVGGGIITARGDGTTGMKVFVRDGVIEGEAPDLPVEVIEV